MIDAVHNRCIDVLAARGRDDDLLGTRLDVLACRFARAEETRALEYYLNAQLAPGQLGWIALSDARLYWHLQDH